MVLHVQHSEIHANRFTDIHLTGSVDSAEIAEREARSRMRWLTDRT